MNKIPMTGEGYERLRDELKKLKTIERPSIIRAIAEARDHGDLSENAEYLAARERQGFIEGRVMELEDKIARAEVIDVSKLSGSVVKFGAKVTLADEETDEEQTFQIVGEDEADVKSGRLSVTSPLARALIGKGKGDSVEVSTPRGAKSYEVVTVGFE
jgi:transcription elongation factor GreA